MVRKGIGGNDFFFQVSFGDLFRPFQKSLHRPPHPIPPCLLPAPQLTALVCTSMQSTSHYLWKQLLIGRKAGRKKGWDWQRYRKEWGNEELETRGPRLCLMWRHRITPTLFYILYLLTVGDGGGGVHWIQTGMHSLECALKECVHLHCACTHKLYIKIAHIQVNACYHLDPSASLNPFRIYTD